MIEIFKRNLFAIGDSGFFLINGHKQIFWLWFWHRFRPRPSTTKPEPGTMMGCGLTSQAKAGPGYPIDRCVIGLSFKKDCLLTIIDSYLHKNKPEHDLGESKHLSFIEKDQQVCAKERTRLH
uniref:Uncharacterized protein n=1 Tax=Romanomermis culicivorax TaxID=13658 RepID=A0A915K826_ROMCU